MSGDVHVRACESLRGRFPWATRLVCHCIHQGECEQLKATLERRFAECGLQLHPSKTKIVYCKSYCRRGGYPIVSFDFLGYQFRPKWMRNRHGKRHVYFMAMISQKAAANIRTQIQGLPWRKWYPRDIEQISRDCQNRLRGWLNYFKLFGESEIRNVLFYFDKCLRRWSQRKYKALRTVSQAAKYVNGIRKTAKHLFAHWQLNRPNKGWVARAV